jgi:hypothetical protein
MASVCQPVGRLSPRVVAVRGTRSRRRVSVLAACVGAAFASGALVPASGHADTTVVSCPTGGGGDQITRGFYLSDYPGSNLGSVTLDYFPLATPPIAVTLTARVGAYDGPILGTSTVSISPPQTATFDFGGAPVAPGSTITFAHTVGGGDPDGYAFFDYGNGVLGDSSDPDECPGVTETDGTDPPLDNFRRETMGVTVTELPASPAGPAANPGPKSDPKCKRLRKKLKKQKRNLASTTASEKRSQIQTNIEDTKQRLRRLGCQ